MGKKLAKGIPSHDMTDNEFLVYLREADRVLKHDWESPERMAQINGDPMLAVLWNARNKAYAKAGEQFVETYGESSVTVLRGMNEVLELLVVGLAVQGPNGQAVCTTDTVIVTGQRIYACARPLYPLIDDEKVREGFWITTDEDKDKG